MPTFSHIRDLPAMAGQHLGYSDWHDITQRQVDLFAEATWDDQWIHTDPARAADGPYGGTIAHGFLTVSLTPSLLAEAWRVDGVEMTVNQGFSQVRLRAPVPVGCRLRMGAELVSTRARPRDFVEAVVKLTFEIEHAGARRVACTAEQVILLKPAVVSPGVADPAGSAQQPLSVEEPA